MCSSSKLLRGVVVTLLAIGTIAANAAEKEWTMLVFLNGNNNLDSFGTTNLKQMETVGSTDQISIVVQWASEAANTTKRLLIQKSQDATNVTSPVVQELPRVDMGQTQTLIDFIQWGVTNYPAKHYFVDVWNHGGGWHRNTLDIFKPFDISYDELSGNSIDTPHLGQALAAAAKIMGHKIDLYASDACLMEMAEVAYEVADSVQVYAGSEETEPGRGWPYDRMLKRWSANPTASALDVGKILTEEYVQSYIDQNDGQVTYSVLDLSKIGALTNSVHGLASQIASLSAADAKTLATAAGSAQAFAYNDYIDLGDFLKQIHLSGLRSISPDVLGGVRAALSDMVVESKFTSSYSKVTGLSMWVPLDNDTYSQYSTKYSALKFQAQTNWSGALQNLVKNSL